MTIAAAASIHPGAHVEPGVALGEGTRVWDGVHIRRGARIGKSCIVGEKTYIAYDVVVGDFVKINASAYLCAGVVVEDFCMIAAHVVFTNDRFPRAGNLDLTGLETSDPTEDTLTTRVRRGSTIGANATVGPGVTLGEFSMVGMGSVVTRDVPAHGLVVGNPARPIGWVCACGRPVEGPMSPAPTGLLVCARCHREFQLDSEETGLHPVSPRPEPR